MGAISLGRARNLTRYIKDPLAFVGGRFARHGDSYLARTGSEMLYAFRHPREIKAVLVDEADAFIKSEFGLEKVLGQGLLTSEGPLWKSRRRTIQPAFTRARIAGYAKAMAEEAETRVATWPREARFDAAAEMTAITLSVVARTLFSHTITDEADEVGRAMTAFQNAVGVFDLLPAWLPTPKHRRTRAALDHFDAMIFGLVDARTRERAERQESTATSEVQPADDLLTALLDAVDPEGDARLDRQALRDELLTLFLAGHETTANALSWAWSYLARHPEVQVRLAAELSAAIDPQRPLGADDLERLPYLRAVCEETMRLRPPAYVLARTATREVQVGDWRLPEGARVVIWSYMTHHDEKWWPEPERFDPERFMHPDPARPKFAYLPFGGGARMCIGKHFALMEMQLILGTLVRRFELKLHDDAEVRPKPRITLTPSGGIPALALRRENPMP